MRAKNNGGPASLCGADVGIAWRLGLQPLAPSRAWRPEPALARENVDDAKEREPRQRGARHAKTPQVTI